ncbi:hypothetical protein [Alienimonas sp. DA493]|uniref:hypothetical protein n=1 Tax=Alienimonas sp. DA493 TaxID=3373605 RepID=UPI0037552CE7
MSDATALLVQAAATLPLVGLIWTVQLVHYPLFDGVGAEGFAEYERRHTVRITWIVAPLMLAELAVSGWLALRVPEGVPAWQCWLRAALTAGIWLSTSFLQVPRHKELAAGFAPAAHAALVGTNWIRTGLWTARGILTLAMLAARMT